MVRLRRVLGKAQNMKFKILKKEDTEHLFFEPAFCKFITKDPICEEAKPLLVCMCPNERKSYLKFVLRKRNGGTGWVKRIFNLDSYKISD
jgi:hypothetical protein